MKEFKNHKLYITPRFLYIRNTETGDISGCGIMGSLRELKNITHIGDCTITVNGERRSCHKVTGIKNLNKTIDELSKAEEYISHEMKFTFRYPITVVRIYCRSLKRFRFYYTLNGRTEGYVRNARDIKITRCWKKRYMKILDFHVRLYETTEEEIEVIIRDMICNCYRLIGDFSSQ